MRILITAGNTHTPIDEVRVITNVFSGRTGSQIALTAHDRGHSVCLLTSHPELVADRSTRAGTSNPTWEVNAYRTFDELRELMEHNIPGKGTQGQPLDAIIHAAAVSDYYLAGTYAPSSNVQFDPDRKTWQSDPAQTGSATPATFVDVAAGKVKSSHRELWLRLLPTPKLVDLIRQPWNFSGILVKFKLEVGPSDAELIQIAEHSRVHSAADLIVANTFSGMRDYAFLGPVDGEYRRIDRQELASRLLDQVERLANRVYHLPG